MNPNDPILTDAADGDGLPDALRWQLRGLRRDAAPQADLWPGIAARIHAEGQPASTIVPLRPRATRRYAWLAMAASVALAIGIGWQRLAPAPSVEPVVVEAAPAEDPTARLLTREAVALTWEYKAALREAGAGRAPTTDNPALLEIDRSAKQVRTALAQDPDARFLLERLQSLYAQRLALTRQLALS